MCLTLRFIKNHVFENAKNGTVLERREKQIL